VFFLFREEEVRKNRRRGEKVLVNETRNGDDLDKKQY